ncbi:MAG: xylulokinase [Ostreibacterium sp.]
MYLGIDLGTSSLKAVLIDDQHQVCAREAAALTVNSPQRNWVEQNPADWIHALHQVMDGLSKQIELNLIKRIGLSGQMHGATLLDNKGRVLRPCILWNDGRALAQCQFLMSHGEAFLNHSGNIAMPGFTAPKLMWVAQNEAAIFKATDKVLLPKDYLRYYLTGEFVTDPSDASGTLWMNPATRCWDDQLLVLSGMVREQMPMIFEGPEECGVLRPNIVEQWGMNKVPVVAGGSDNACGALGMGVSHHGQSFISLGTSGVCFHASDHHMPCPQKTVHAFAHAVPNTWYQMTVTLSAASSLAWLAHVLDVKVSALLTKLSHSGLSVTDVIFLPYLNGERSPHNNPDARGVFMNLSSQTSDIDLCLAVLEGVVFSFCDGMDALGESGATITANYAIGGGIRSRLWLQLMADALQIPVMCLSGAEVSASVGAARLAMNDQQHAYPIPETIQTLTPNYHQMAYLQDKLARYRSLYQVCMPLFQNKNKF